MTCDVENAEIVPRIDPTTRLANHIQLYSDLSGLRAQDLHEGGALILLEIIDHDVIRRFFLAYGAGATDALMCNIATRIKKILNASSRIYCVGVGRFALLSFRNSIELGAFLDQLRNTLNFPYQLDDFSMLVKIAVGWLSMDVVMESPHDALRKVSSAIAAGSGSGQLLCHYRPDLDRLNIRRGELLRDVPAALKGHQFRLVYQPKVDYFGCVKGVEALIRWRHPVLGDVSPAEFIPLADGTELMRPITQWVIAEIARTAQMLLSKSTPTRVSFNASSKNLDDPGFANLLKAEIDQLTVPPKLIEIECTEYSAIASAQALETLKSLKSMGFSIALDDFGSGYSNLASLLSLPIDSLKIDKSLTDGVLVDQNAMNLLKGVVDLGKTLGFVVVVEGIESKEMADRMMHIGVDELQGYWIAKPMELEALHTYLAAKSG